MMREDWIALTGALLVAATASFAFSLWEDRQETSARQRVIAAGAIPVLQDVDSLLVNVRDRLAAADPPAGEYNAAVIQFSTEWRSELDHRLQDQIRKAVALDVRSRQLTAAYRALNVLCSEYESLQDQPRIDSPAVARNASQMADSVIRLADSAGLALASSSELP